MKLAKKLISFSILSLIYSSCSFLSTHYKREYKVESSMFGVDVYLQTGKLLGKTPLDLVHKDIEDVMDGRFVTLILLKEGYFTRVVLFDATESVNIKIDLKIDNAFKENKVTKKTQWEQILKVRDAKAKNKNDLLLIQIESKNRIIKKMQEVLESLSLKDKNDTRNSKKLDYKNLTNQMQSEIEKVLMINKAKLSSNLSCKKVEKKRCPSYVNKYYLPRETNEVINQLLGIQFLILNGQFIIAKDKILELEVQHPHIPSLYTLLGYVEMQLKKFPEAKEYIKKSLSLNKNDQMANRLLVYLDKLSGEMK